MNQIDSDGVGFQCFNRESFHKAMNVEAEIGSGNEFAMPESFQFKSHLNRFICVLFAGVLFTLICMISQRKKAEETYALLEYEADEI